MEVKMGHGLLRSWTTSVEYIHTWGTQGGAHGQTDFLNERHRGH